MNQPNVVPIARGETRQCTITPLWFVQGSEYNILPGRFELLINGENAFRAIVDIRPEVASAQPWLLDVID